MRPLLVALALLLVGGFIGWKLAKGSVAVTDFQEYKVSVEQRNKLEGQLADADIALMTKQQETNDARDKEVVKYVTVYREKIKDPVTAQCVRDSGILQLYDSTVSTPVK